MDSRVEATLDEWQIRSTEPGYAGLYRLSDVEFSGAVSVDETVGFMVNGRMVGVTGGTIEDFENTSFSAQEAESPALPLLFTMLERDAEQEGEYYTGETPIRDVDQTLSSGAFTGYIELSENVFSGDYFYIYYGGTSFNVAFLGNDDRLVTGDEAKRRAMGEVGIYSVNSVGIDVIDIPEPEEHGSVASATALEDSTSEAPVTEPEEHREDEVVSEQETQPAPEEAELAASALTDDPDAIGEADSGAHQAEGDDTVTIPPLDPDRADEADPLVEPDQEEAAPHAEADPEKEPEEESVSSEELDRLAAENQQLHQRIDELETRLSTAGPSTPAAESRSPRAALDETNLFVRYGTKAKATLEHALDGESTQEELIENLRLEWHTMFDADNVEVDGQPYPAFLQQSTEYQFVEWILTELLFELIESGDVRGFTELLDVMTEIDRIELHGNVPVQTEQGGERQNTAYECDVIFRDTMGEPVLIAQIHDSREPIQDAPVEELLEHAKSITTERGSVVGAFFVGSSYFEPPALETVVDATGGGLFRGGSRTSYVSVSRKSGFHFCLVEARNGSFYLNIPNR